jgi:hypothetical protein
VCENSLFQLPPRIVFLGWRFMMIVGDIHGLPTREGQTKILLYKKALEFSHSLGQKPTAPLWLVGPLIP